MSMRAAEIHLADREVIVEDAVRAASCPSTMTKRDHLVERVAQFRVEPAGIDRVDLEAAAGVIERARLVAEAVMALVLIARHHVLQRAGLARHEIGLRGPVLQERLAFPGAMPGDAEGRQV